MKKVFRWTLLSLAVCGTFVVFASNATNRIQDVRPPIVRVSPSEAVVDPYIEFMMTISFRYARNIVIAPSNSSVYVYDIDDDGLVYRVVPKTLTTNPTGAAES